MGTKKVQITDLKIDDRNANKGTDQGKDLLAVSLQKYGAGRSVLIDKDGKVIAGNHTVKEAYRQGITDVIVVETDGSQLVAVKRTDIKKDSKEGHELALADNRVSQANLNFDIDLIRDLNAEFDLDLGEIGFDMADGGPNFSEAEPDAMESMETSGGYESAGTGTGNSQNVFPFMASLTKAQRLDIDKVKKELGLKSDTDFLLTAAKFLKDNR